MKLLALLLIWASGQTKADWFGWLVAFGVLWTIGSLVSLGDGKFGDNDIPNIVESTHDSFAGPDYRGQSFTARGNLVSAARVKPDSIHAFDSWYPGQDNSHEYILVTKLDSDRFAVCTSNDPKFISDVMHRWTPNDRVSINGKILAADAPPDWSSPRGYDTRPDVIYLARGCSIEWY